MVTSTEKIKINRVQTGLRIEKKILKVLKGTAEYRDLSVGQLLEVVLMHAFEAKNPFNKDSLKVINELKKIYELDYNVHDYEKFIDKGK